MKAPTEHVQIFHKYDSLITREVSCALMLLHMYCMDIHVFIYLLYDVVGGG